MQSEQRILHLALLPFWSAIAWHAVTLAKSLRNRGHACWLAARRDSPLAAHATREGLPIPQELLLPDLRPWNWLGAVAALRRFLTAQRIDLIFVHTGQGHLEAHTARRGLPSALVRVRADARMPRGGRLHRWLYEHGAERIAVTGRYMLQEHLAPMQLEEGRLAVLPPGIDLDQVERATAEDRGQARAEIRTRYEIPSGVPLIGVIGRLSPIKGHGVLLRAAAQMARDGRHFRVLIVGDEKEVSPASLREQARELGIADRIVLTGEVADPLLHAAALDVGVIPSLGSEAVSRSALEFMSVGVPVVGTTVGILPEVIDVDELLVSPDRPEPLAAALARLLDDPTWAGRLGERLYARVKAEYSLDVLGERAEQIMAAALQVRRQEQPGAWDEPEDAQAGAPVGNHHRAE
ncbi:MAG: glycosyltransferase [Candidatus Eisenbacteria bacterium]|nr:glycosyltransferase [Candidatus Eisenbacteria bacterium]